MDYQSFYELLFSFDLVEPIDKYLLSLVENEIKDRKDKDTLLVFFTVMLSLIDDGNACVSLDEQTLLNKWHRKVNGKEVLFKEANDNTASFEEIRKQDNEIIKALKTINNEPLNTLIGDRQFFIKDNGYLYVKKYYDAKNSIIDSIRRLFKDRGTSLRYTDYLSKSASPLTNGQVNAIGKGLNRNLIITGGPGTGKTTSLLFLLLNLLEADNNQFVYLLAPSGKASSRMKESVISGLSFVDKNKLRKEVVDKVENLQESTIHRLLHIDPNTNMFTRNRNYRFSDNSIFVIDEASMIDICLFASLLEAIPDSARVFILGDYNQLPSVDNGAVFADLVDMPYLKNDYVSWLTEFVRFKKDSEVFRLASEVNGDTPLSKKDWKDYSSFEVLELNEENKDKKPVLFYENPNDIKEEKNAISSMIKKWGEKFYQGLQDKCTNITDNNQLIDIYPSVSKAKILCAVNEGIRGTKTINQYIRKNFIDNKKPTSIYGYYPGEIIMINKNNAILDLYNGDSGLLVTFKCDDTLYFMIEKKSAVAKEVDKKDNVKDQIFSLNIDTRTFSFYPLRLIAEEEYDLAYAITIHKSQGSDFDDIFIILPTDEGHPLLTRQIVYTAITRSKGITYILSNHNRLEEAQKNYEKRDTNIA